MKMGLPWKEQETGFLTPMLSDCTDRPTPAAPTYGPEVQEALKWALGVTTLDQYDSSTPLDHTILKSLIENNRPALWLDHGGWPANQSGELPPLGARQYMGHAKVIAGYDDQDTPDPRDDLCLIYDPWPSYNDEAKLPLNTIKGPQDTYDPYWLPQGDVLGDLPNDIFLVPPDPIL